MWDLKNKYEIKQKISFNVSLKKSINYYTHKLIPKFNQENSCFEWLFNQIFNLKLLTIILYSNLKTPKNKYVSENKTK